MPPYVNAFCTSAASCATNWKAAPATNTELKITPPQITITGTSSTFAAVQSTSTAISAYPSTSTPWVIRPSLRSANWSAPTWASTGAGRTSRMSKEPSRIRPPRTSIEPSSRSARPNAVAARPYSRATSGSVQPPSVSTCENISRIAAKSSPVISRLPTTVRAKEVR